MPAVFYARIANKVYGPLDGDKLKKLAAAGKITRDDAVSKDGKTGWTLAGNVKGLFPPAELLVSDRPRPIETIVRREPTAAPSEGQTSHTKYSEDLVVYAAQATRDTTVSLCANMTETLAPLFITVPRHQNLWVNSGSGRRPRL